MLKLFRNNFKKTNDCIILATPLIIFLSILSWYISYAVNIVDSLQKLIFAIITVLIMASGCLSAWLYMAKKTIKMSNTVFVFDKDRNKAFRELILSLPKGVGRLFLPILCVITLTIIVYGGVATLITFIVTKFIGTVDLNLINTENLLLSSQELINEINELTTHEIIVINCWYLSILLITTLISFFGILWIPEIVYCEKNPFKALFFAIQKLIITFPKTLLLFIYISFLSIAISVVNTLLMFNPITYFIVLLLYYYFIVYIVVLLFRYYEQTFLKNEKEM